MEEHLHPTSKTPIKGTIIQVGESLQRGDRYAAEDGSWTESEYANRGGILHNKGIMWVRPAPVRSRAPRNRPRPSSGPDARIVDL